MTGMLIAGERTEGAAGEGIDVVDPATEETIESVPRGTAADVDAAVEAAHKAFGEWQKTDAEDRATLLRKAIALIERDRKDADDVARARAGQAGDRGRRRDPPPDPRPELLRRPRDEGARLLPRRCRRALSKAYGMVIRRPMGVVAAIVPNNFPLTLLGTKLAPALMAGNTIVVKPAATTPLTTLKIADLLLEAGVPARRGQRRSPAAARRSATRSSPTTRSAAWRSPARPRSAATSWAWPRRS